MLQQIDDFHGRASRVVVVKLRRVLGIDHPLVNTLKGLLYIKDVHTDLAERRAVVSEGSIADRWTWNGREPAIEDRKLRGQCRKDGQFIGSEVVQDFLRVIYILALMKIAFYKALHIGRSFSVITKNLQVDSGEVVIGIGIELSLKFRQGLNRSWVSTGIRIAFGSGQSIDTPVLLLEGTEHVVERAVLHHEYDDVL